METKVSSVALSVKLHYGVEEDLLHVGGVGSSPNLYLNDWAMGTRKDIMAVALRLLAETHDDEVLVIGLVPSQKPATAPETEEEGDPGPGELGGW